MRVIDMTKKLLISLLLVGSFSNIFGQDLHFSQFYSSPLTLNPANTGEMNKDIRASFIRREQWSSIASSFITNALSTDFSFTGGILSQDKLAFGVVLYDDNMGEGIIKSQSALFSTAYHRAIDRHHLHDLSLGLQVGMMRKNIDGDFQFESQFNDWRFDNGIESGENLDALNDNNFSLHIGVLWKYTIKPKKLRYYLGVSGFQVTAPSEGFLSSTDNSLSPRLTIHTGVDYKITEKFILSPKFLFMTQSNARDINLGAMVSYDFSENFRLMGGAWTRLSDANIMMVGTRLYKNYEVKFSYDATSSSLVDVQGIQNTANDGRVAAWEISFIFIGNIFKSNPENYTIPCGIF
ncbi:MAG: type IX secretion system membrane protein PorP/SprF [Cytophagales bacterium]|nr:type IX secretion system membrane protein PorP/SprF [Cytophagales bacterium]